jgi:hypothetical protein
LPEPITRDALYELVWSSPVYKVAKDFGISGVALAKACAKAGIPLPPRGHWARLQHGGKSRRAPLPKVRLGQDVAIRFREKRKLEPADEIPDDVAVEIAAIREAEPPTVSERLAKPHPLLQSLRAYGIDTKGLEKRRLRILDALLRIFEMRKWPVGSDDGTLWVRIESERISFSITEPMKQRRVETTAEERKRSYYGEWKTVHEPSGELRLALDAQFMYPKKEWRDRPGGLLEDRLQDILVGVLTAFARLRERTRERAEREAREIERQHRRWVEEGRVKRLVENRSAWELAQGLRAYVDAAAEALDPTRSGVSEWLAWCRAYADALDPLLNGATEQSIEDFVGRISPTKNPRLDSRPE